jgi:hypothetical protein
MRAGLPGAPRGRARAHAPVGRASHERQLANSLKPGWPRRRHARMDSRTSAVRVHRRMAFCSSPSRSTASSAGSAAACLPPGSRSRSSPSCGRGDPCLPPRTQTVSVPLARGPVPLERWRRSSAASPCSPPGARRSGRASAGSWSASGSPRRCLATRSSPPAWRERRSRGSPYPPGADAATSPWATSSAPRSLRRAQCGRARPRQAARARCRHTPSPSAGRGRAHGHATHGRGHPERDRAAEGAALLVLYAAYLGASVAVGV